MFRWLGIILGAVRAAMRGRHDLATENLAKVGLINQVESIMLFVQLVEGKPMALQQHLAFGLLRIKVPTVIWLLLP